MANITTEICLIGKKGGHRKKFDVHGDVKIIEYDYEDESSKLPISLTSSDSETGAVLCTICDYDDNGNCNSRMTGFKNQAPTVFSTMKYDNQNRLIESKSDNYIATYEYYSNGKIKKYEKHIDSIEEIAEYNKNGLEISYVNKIDGKITESRSTVVNGKSVSCEIYENTQYSTKINKYSYHNACGNKQYESFYLEQKTTDGVGAKYITCLVDKGRDYKYDEDGVLVGFVLDRIIKISDTVASNESHEMTYVKSPNDSRTTLYMNGKPYVENMDYMGFDLEIVHSVSETTINDLLHDNDSPMYNLYKAYRKNQYSATYKNDFEGNVISEFEIVIGDRYNETSKYQVHLDKSIKLTEMTYASKLYNFSISKVEKISAQNTEIGTELQLEMMDNDRIVRSYTFQLENGMNDELIDYLQNVIKKDKGICKCKDNFMKAVKGIESMANANK